MMAGAGFACPKEEFSITKSIMSQKEYELFTKLSKNMADRAGMGVRHPGQPAVEGISAQPRSRWIISAATSAGLTPEIRLAWPRFMGCTAESFSRASSRRPWMWA